MSQSVSPPQNSGRISRSPSGEREVNGVYAHGGRQMSSMDTRESRCSPSSEHVFARPNSRPPQNAQASQEMFEGGDRNVGGTQREGEFYSNLIKISREQQELETSKEAIIVQIAQIKENLALMKAEHEAKRKEREYLKNVIVKEQDNYENHTTKLNEELDLIREMFPGLEIISANLNTYLEQKDIVYRICEKYKIRKYEEAKMSAENVRYQLQSENETLIAQVKNIKESAKEVDGKAISEINDIKGKLETVKLKVKEAREYLFELKLQKAKLSADVKHATDEADKVSIKTVQLKKKMASLKEDGEEIKSSRKAAADDKKMKYDAMKNKLTTIVSDKLKEEQTISELKKRTEELESFIAKSKEEECALIEKIVTDTEVSRVFRDEVSVLKEELQVTRNIEEENRFIELKNEEDKNELARLTEETESLQKSNSIEENKILILGQRLDIARDEESKRIEMGEELKHKNGNVLKCISGTKEMIMNVINSLKIRNEECVSEAAELERQLSELRNANKESHRKLNDQLSISAQREEELDHLADNVSSLQVEVDNLEQDIFITDDKFEKDQTEITATKNQKIEELTNLQKKAERKCAVIQDIKDLESDLMAKENEHRERSKLKKEESDALEQAALGELKTFKGELETSYRQVKTDSTMSESELADLQKTENELAIEIEELEQIQAKINHEYALMKKSAKWFEKRLVQISEMTKQWKRDKDNIGESQITQTSTQQMQPDASGEKEKKTDDFVIPAAATALLYASSATTATASQASRAKKFAELKEEKKYNYDDDSSSGISMTDDPNWKKKLPLFSYSQKSSVKSGVEKPIAEEKVKRVRPVRALVGRKLKKNVANKTSDILEDMCN